VYDYLNGTRMKTFAYPETKNRAHLDEVSRLYYCNEYQTVISASWDTTICIHDESNPEHGILLRRMTGGHTGDISCLSFSYNLSLLASGSLDCTLQIWDYEFGRLDGTCIGHTSGITCLVFLDPYPFLLSCDIAGNVCVWAMRPSKYKCMCVFRFKVQGNTTTNSIAYISSVSIYCERKKPSSTGLGEILHYYLIGGDEKGFLTIWDFFPVLSRLDADFNIKPVDVPVECGNPQRNLRVNATEIMRKVKQSPEWLSFLSREPQCSFHFSHRQMPLLHLNVADCLRQWQAHEEIIYSIQVIAESTTISLISSSFDRMAKLWTLNGECLGVLTQGDMEVPRQRWSFTIDYASREYAKLVVAKPVIKEVMEVQQLMEETNVSARKSYKKKDLKEKRNNSAAYMEELQSTLLLPPLNLSKGKALAVNTSALRKTPRTKPININNAGRSIRNSPRHGF